MKRNHITTIVGFILLITGLYFAKTALEPQGIMRALPYICIGLGCGIFGHGMGDTISRRALKSSPEIQKKLEIEKNDERNILIGNRAKAKAYDMMVFVFGALMVAFALMGIDMAVVLLLASAYLFVMGYGVYFRCKFDKEM